MLKSYYFNDLFYYIPFYYDIFLFGLILKAHKYLKKIK